MRTGRFRIGRALFKSILVAIAAIALVRFAMALPGDQIADGVLGQADFYHNNMNNPDGAALLTPYGVAVDKVNGRLYVADKDNGRVLGWSNLSSFTSGAAADLEIGQPDFHGPRWMDSCNNGVPTATQKLCEPISVAVDPAGNLFIGDFGRGQIVEYDNPYNKNTRTIDTDGDHVFGQGFDVNQGVCVGPSQNSLCNPVQIAFDSLGNMWVADGFRALRFNTPLNPNSGEPGAGDGTPDAVFGTCGSYGANNCPNNGAGSADSYNASGIAVDNSTGNVIVTSGVRALMLLNPLAPGGGTPGNPGSAGDATADVVYGKSSFTDTNPDPSCSQNAPTTGVLCTAYGAAFDNSGNLYIGDFNSNLVYEYASGSTTPEATIGGGASFNGCMNYPPTSASLCLPAEIATDSTGALWVADTGANRVISFAAKQRVLGQGDFAHNGFNFPRAQSLSFPNTVAFDFTGLPVHVYVIDQANNRVLGWKDINDFQATPRPPADLVIGQDNFLSTVCNDTANAKASQTGVGSNSLCLSISGSPAMSPGIAVDSHGDLYISDSGNSRIFEVFTPFTRNQAAGLAADRIFGQDSPFNGFCDAGGSTNADTLCFPAGLAVDGSDTLWVADSGRNRVLGYLDPNKTPGGNGTPGQAGDVTADFVLGQGAQGNDFASSTNVCFGTPSVTATTLCKPLGVAADAAGNVEVADGNASRILGYNTPLNSGSGEPGAGDAVADLVFGQSGSFTSANCAFPTSADSLCFPQGIASDSIGNLYVADGIGRVLEYDNPRAPGGGSPGTPGKAGDATADRVYGTGGSFGDVPTDNCEHGTLPGDVNGLGPDSLCNPVGAGVSPQSEVLAIADNANNRIVAYDHPLAAPASPTATPTATPTTTGPTPTATATATSTSTPTPTPTSTPAFSGILSVKPTQIKVSAPIGGKTVSAHFQINNLSKTEPLFVTVESTHPNSGFVVVNGGGSNIKIAPRGNRVVVVHYTAQTVSDHDFVRLINSDPNQQNPIPEVDFVGTGIPGKLPKSLKLPPRPPATAGKTAIYTIGITNTGKGLISGTIGQFSNGKVFQLTEGTGHFSIGPRQHLNVTISFSPPSAGTYFDTIPVDVDQIPDPRFHPVLLPVSGKAK